MRLSILHVESPNPTSTSSAKFKSGKRATSLTRQLRAERDSTYPAPIMYGGNPSTGCGKFFGGYTEGGK